MGQIFVVIVVTVVPATTLYLVVFPKVPVTLAAHSTDSHDGVNINTYIQHVVRKYYSVYV